jgi:hypothetical protein
MRWDAADWQAWRPEEAAERLRGIDVPWYVAAGWSIDLFVGRERRAHEDLELAIPAHRFGDVAAALGDLEWYAPTGDEELGPVAEDPGLLLQRHQTWGLDVPANAWRIDVFREPTDGDTWVCRRDDRIRLPYDELIEHNAAGIPYVRPEVALLFKAKAARPKDEDDLAAVLPLLDATRRRLLHDWLELVHPGHPWLARLVGVPGTPPVPGTSGRYQPPPSPA